MKIAIVYGTRPELIKLIPLIYELRKHHSILVTLINTGQHIDMLREIEVCFDIKPDISLNTMTENQSLTDILVNVAKAIEPVLKSINPDLVLVQGDTSTVSAVGTVCFYNKLYVGHVEAGLRSYDMTQPFPEEFNRRVISLLATLNFAPTLNAKQNLYNEGVNPNQIFVTGNTIVDMVHYVSKMWVPEKGINSNRILITAHRRENHGEGLMNICHAIDKISNEFPHIEFIWPLHPNPAVRETVTGYLENNKNVTLCEPLNYIDLVRELNNAYIIWTDSGGIQEECPSFKKPVLILRNVTERPEVVESGFGLLTGTDVDMIYNVTKTLLTDKEEYSKMISGENPFGDGKAAVRIIDVIKQWFNEGADYQQ